MGWFKTVKGDSPSLAQIDMTLSVGVGEEGIVRGTLLRVDSSYNTAGGGVFRAAQAVDAADPATYIYFALVGQDDYQAGMAGSIGQGVATQSTADLPNEAAGAGAARITGLAVGQPEAFETDQFTGVDGLFPVGTKLTCGDDGKLVPATAGDCVIATVTVAPFYRWVNDAAVDGVNRTGGQVKVLQALTTWAAAVA